MSNTHKPFSGLFLLTGIVIAAILFLQGARVTFDHAANSLEWQKGRRSKNVEDKRSNPDIAASNELSVPAPTNVPDSISVPTQTEEPLNTGCQHQTVCGIINSPNPGYDGWNLRSCPSLNASCLVPDYPYLVAGEQVQIINSTSTNQDGVTWIQIRSARLGKSGWIASNGISF